MTGAGISAASGVPTFRGPGGLWRTRRPEQLATPDAFAADPVLVWEWYDWRRQTVARCQPNRGHDVIAAWSARVPAFTLITQNVDGLHERAGTRDVVRFHGSIWQIRCVAGCAASGGGWRDETVPLPHLPYSARTAEAWLARASSGSARASTPRSVTAVSPRPRATCF